MQRLLIISPYFAPISTPDHQRVRLVLPYLREYGWEAEVLAVDSASVAAPLDEWLAHGLPATVPIHRVRALGLGWSRLPGLGTLTFRALGALRRKGDALLAAKKFDLVYFSTTQFGLHVLGPRWKQKFGVPFVMDYQDPWVSDYYRTHPEVTPPGGRLKYALADRLNRRQEPRVLRHCSGITSVSPAYPRQLCQRYPWLKLENWEGSVPPAASGEAKADIARAEPPNRATSQARSNFNFPNFPGQLSSVVLPFPGDERDLVRVAADGTTQNIFSPGDGKQHWVYVGRGAADMALALRGIFGALHNYGQARPEFLKTLRLHFIGTSYAAEGRGHKTVEPLAAEYGLADLVQEITDRIPYSQTLRCLLDADALIVPGSDDPGYTASKIYPYLLAEKPLLAVFHKNSSVVGLLQKVGGGLCVPFQTGETAAELAMRIGQAWFANPGSPASGQPPTDLRSPLSTLSASIFPPRIPLNRVAFAPHTARAQARFLGEFFSHCIHRPTEIP